jgi:hypothetical protein
MRLSGGSGPARDRFAGFAGVLVGEARGVRKLVPPAGFESSPLRAAKRQNKSRQIFGLHDPSHFGTNRLMFE